MAAYLDWDWAEAGRLYAHAASLEPGLGYDRFLHAWYLSFVGDLEGAARQAAAGHRLDPLSFFGQVIGIAIRIFAQDHDAAVAKLGCALVGLGRTAEAEALLAELEERWQSDPLCPAAVATLHLHLGHRETFYRWMDRALEAREPFCVALNVERLWEEAWGDEEYRALVRQVGLDGVGPRALSSS